MLNALPQFILQYLHIIINGKGCICLLQVAEYESFVRKRITQLRHRIYVFEHKMSLDLGKSGSYMRSISTDKAMPSMHEFPRICEYLGVTPQEFFTAAGDETDCKPLMAVTYRNCR